VNRLYFEEIKEGYSFTTSSKPITGTEIDMVAQLSGADLPGFLDNEFAQSWGFKARVNDAYLQFNGQEEGINTYGRMVDLLIGERRLSVPQILEDGGKDSRK
jgi:hypothetical protein